MILAEGILLALAAPLMVLLLFARSHTRRMLLFTILGMVVCLLGAYINSFIAYQMNLDDMDAVVVVAPMVEEIAKYLPLAFYMLVFEPSRRRVIDAALALGSGFALFENAGFLAAWGTADMLTLALRGLAVGAMHAGSTAFVGLALSYSRETAWPRGTAMAGVLCIAIIYHAIYNLLVSYPGPLRYLGYALPMAFALVLALGYQRASRPAADG